VPNPAYATPTAEAEPDEFGEWLVVREVTDEPTRTHAIHLLGRPGKPVGEVRDWRRRGLVFALTDPAAPPGENVAAAVVFVPVDDDTLELSSVAVVADYGASCLPRRLLEPVSHIVSARGVARIVVRPDVAARLGGLRLRPAPVTGGGQGSWSELEL
jgi:hypothetical protein